MSRVDFEVEVFGVWKEGGYGEETEGEEGGVREGDAAATAAATGAGRPCGRALKYDERANEDLKAMLFGPLKNKDDINI